MYPGGRSSSAPDRDGEVPTIASAGRRRDYSAENARRNERARDEGYRSYAHKRQVEGEQRGLTRSQARGHPRRDEASARVVRAIREGSDTVVTVQRVRMPDGSIEERLLVAVVDENGKVVAYSMPKGVSSTLVGQIADIGAAATILDYNRRLGKTPGGDEDEDEDA